MKSIVKLKEAEADRSSVGSKASNLCLLKLNGFNVPQGLVVTTVVYREFMKQNLLEEKVGLLLHEIDYKSTDSIIETSKKIGELMLNGVMPQNIKEDICMELSESHIKKVAVRSSATAEDLTNVSFAGIYNSYLNTKPEEVADRIKECWASLYTPEAIFYRNYHKIKNNPEMAVLLQEMVETEFAGVIFTKDPLQNRHVCIELVKGSCDNLVSGKTTPERHYFERPSLEIIKNEDAHNFLGLEEPSLKELAVISIEIEKSLGCPQDIEWGISGNVIYILQSRPITTIDLGDNHN